MDDVQEYKFSTTFPHVPGLIVLHISRTMSRVLLGIGDSKEAKSTAGLTIILNQDMDLHCYLSHCHVQNTTGQISNDSLKTDI